MSTHIKRTIETLLVILALSFSLVTFNPLSSYIEKIVEEQKTNLIQFLADKTGISFDYSSISPSILKRILIKNISLFDYQTKEKIGEMEFCEVEYNILSLIFGNFEDLIKHIKISNTYVKIDRKKNKELIEKLSSLIKKDAKENKKEYAPLSVFTNYFYECKMTKDVPSSCFWPQPKVTSTALLLTKKENREAEDERLFVRLVSSLFSSRRRTIKNNLNGMLRQERLVGASPVATFNIEDFFASLALDPSLRAENLKCEDFVAIANRLLAYSL